MGTFFHNFKNKIKKHLQNRKCYDNIIPVPKWPGSSVGLERQPVTLEVVGSSPIRVAIRCYGSGGRAHPW